MGLLTLNQYILLDPILLCFMMCATWGMARVASLHKRPFTLSWWLWLSFTGISLACTISVKFVGLFVVLLVGFHTAYELWRELGDLSNPIVSNLPTSSLNSYIENYANSVFFYLILYVTMINNFNIAYVYLWSYCCNN